MEFLTEIRWHIYYSKLDLSSWRDRDRENDWEFTYVSI